MFVPSKMFLTKGVGVHKDRLASFEAALRDAGIEKCNLVYVSSILPPKCKIINRSQGLQELSAGQITFCVMARNETNEPNRLVSAAVGVAVPTNKDSQHGYLSEHHSFGETDHSYFDDFFQEAAKKRPETENYMLYLTNAVFAALTLLTIKEWTFNVYSFPLYMLVMTGSIAVFIKFKVGKLRKGKQELIDLALNNSINAIRDFMELSLKSLNKPK